MRNVRRLRSKTKKRDNIVPLRSAPFDANIYHVNVVVVGGGGGEALTSCLLSRQHNFSPPNKYLTCLPPVAVAVFLQGFHYFTKPFRRQ